MACRALCGVTVGLLGLGGCVEAFDGSNLQIDFAMGVQAAARPGRTPAPDQPPPDTHFELYAADLVYELDAQGDVVVDDRGRPVVKQAYVFEVTEFEIRPAIDRSSPCFIELGDTRFPGLHVTQIAEKVADAVEAEAGTRDPFEPGLDPDLVTDLLNAGRRFELLEKYETILKVVSSHEPFRYQDAATIGAAGDCPGQASAIPHPTCRDDASNAQRLRVCRELWAAHEDFYEGSDKVFTLPLNGRYLGMVEGMNPANDGFVGGSSMFVDVNLVGYEAYVLNWQYNDYDGNGAPDFPTGVTPLDRGYLYMQGQPQEISRGVTTVPLRHPTNANISADLAILPNLGHDDVHF